MLTTSMGISALESHECEWMRAHEELSRLARERAAADAEGGRWLLAALRSAAHVHLGFGSFGEYIEQLFGYTRRSTQERLRVAEALEALPAIRAALESGELNWSAVRELTRVAIAETEVEWLKVARGKTVHQLEALVAGKSPGERPNSASKPGAQRHVLRFEVAAETLCLFREAMNKLRRDSGDRTSLDHDSALMLMARHILGGPTDEGRAPYQIALSLCPQCHQACQQASGELVPVAAEVVAMAECDNQHLGVIPATASEGAFSSESSAAAAAGTSAEDAHTGVAAEADDNADRAHVGARMEPEPSQRQGVRTAARAKQSIPPATRRTVLRRDHHRCCVPGCRNFRFLDVHHVVPSSEGGSNQASNLVTLCGAHHRAVHRGELLIAGSAPEGLGFRHADGSDYGRPVDPHAIDVDTKAFAVLRNLGFREGEVRRVLAELRRTRGGEAQNIERVVRDALARLTPTRTP